MRTSTSQGANGGPKPVAERFRVARATLIFDRFMNYFVMVGGISIILAVSFIFFFILFQIWPLFKGASVEEDRVVSTGEREFVTMGVDEWLELPFFVEPDGSFHFLDLVDPGRPYNRGRFALDTGLPDEAEYSVIRYNSRNSQVLLGTDDGRFSAVKVNYRATFPDRGGREVAAELDALPLLRIGREGVPLESLAYGDSGTRKLAAAVQRVDGRAELHAVTLDQPRTLFGVGEIAVDRSFDLSDMITGNPFEVLIPWEADSVLVATEDGRIHYIFYQRGEFNVRQTFEPFSDLEDSSIASINFVLGDVSIVFTSPTGEMRVWSLYRDPESGNRIYGHSKTFDSMAGGATFFSSSLRNKAFLTGRENLASLRYMTTEVVRWESELPFDIREAQIAPRYNRLLFLDRENNLHFYNLDDPHPIAGWKSFFGKIQYEGQAEASWEWQSTGGRDDFERKLSMVPLIMGTMKGTLYAMIFAMPIALLAALYTSQFLKPNIKRYVKPTMEIMASLPSVVLGFLAALWLAPIVSNAVPSVVAGSLGVLICAVAMGWAWTSLPIRWRVKVPQGFEFLLLIVPALSAGWLGWHFGAFIEQVFFVVTDPNTGLRVADFRMWYPEKLNLPFEQRNAFVVGFVMGFAVIPIIFTISEDSMSNVPDAFRSGSLALGASRWQTAINIVLPTAAAGIFSALMIGLGRAVGETMIVVMATGNVPVTELNPFTGMRTLSANIAVELPEAPHLGTLYRTLFLGAMILFLLTFLVNTVAEILRQKLRERYRAVE